MNGKQKQELLAVLHAQLHARKEEHLRWASNIVGTKETDPNDQATCEEEMALNASMAERALAAQLRVERAIIRLENGFDGLCVDCREPISAQRLMLEPCASRCTECKKEHETRVMHLFGARAAAF